jgi:hypothetical protein
MQIRIRCQGAVTVPLAQLQGLQHGLKSLSPENHKKLRALIIRKGFIDPVAVWRQGDDYFLLNGHQRVGVVRALVAEGYQCPDIPVTVVDAANLKEAKDHVLAMSSSFATVEEEGLRNFLRDSEIATEILLDEMRLTDFSMRDFIDSMTDEIEMTPIDFPDAPLAAPIARQTPAADDQMSNTQKYKNETQALESFLASDVRRITIYMNPTDYDSAVARMAKISDVHELKDYRDVLFKLLEVYDAATPAD